MKVAFQPAQAHLVPGYRLDDRYELLYPYAQGGMATVWVGRIQGKHGFQKLVAVKTILPHYARDEGFRTMFLDEARLASRIRHPNVAELDDLGEESGTLYMVLEWIDGDSWAKLHAAVLASGQPYPVDLMLRIAADACAGLHAAHELRGDDGALLNVVHRDVSPQNILISTVGVTKVIDFGVAKARDRLTEETRTGLLKGKIEYAAPELAMMKPSDRRADIWAIGVILYQLFSGRLPFEGRNDLASLRNLTSGKPPPPLPPEVPGAVAAVIMRALHPQVEGRFATAMDMERAIEAAIARPTSTADVASYVHACLADRVEMRRNDLAAALGEANERARARAARGSHPDLGGGGEGLGVAMPPPGSGGYRGSLPSLHENLPAEAWLPPDSLPAQRAPMPSYPAPGEAGVPSGPGSAQASARASARASQRAPERPELRPGHWALMAGAALVTLAVWAAVGMIALRDRRPRLEASDAMEHTSPAGSAVPR